MEEGEEERNIGEERKGRREEREGGCFSEY